MSAAPAALSTDYRAEKYKAIRRRVVEAREIQLKRFTGEKIYCNGQMKTRHLKKYCRPQAEAQGLLDNAMQKLGLSARDLRAF